jgi:hypothetical protein
MFKKSVKKGKCIQCGMKNCKHCQCIGKKCGHHDKKTLFCPLERVNKHPVCKKCKISKEKSNSRKKSNSRTKSPRSETKSKSNSRSPKRKPENNEGDMEVNIVAERKVHAPDFIQIAFDEEGNQVEVNARTGEILRKLESKRKSLRKKTKSFRRKEEGKTKSVKRAKALALSHIQAELRHETVF